MAYLNVKERVIEAKIVYYGAGLSGKTTNLEQVKRLSTDGRCGEMMTLDTDGDRTLFFDWLPFNMGKFNGCDVKMQLFTVPGQARYAETRKKVLASADGVVLVLDSQSAALESNRQILSDLREHLQANGLAGELPIVVQLNKRDLPSAMAPAELLKEVGLEGKPYVEAVAARGEGVFETLSEASKRVLQYIRESARNRSSDIRSGTKSGLDGESLYADLTAQTHGAPAAASAAPAAPATSGAPDSAKDAPKAPARLAAAPAAAGPATPSSSAANTVVVRSNGVSHASNGSAHATANAAPNGAGSNGAASSGAASSAATPSASQLGEVISALRGLARRLDAIEAQIPTAVAAAVGDLDRRLAARNDTRGELGALTEAQRALETRLAGLEERWSVGRAEDGRALGEGLGALGSELSTKLAKLAESLPTRDALAKEHAAVVTLTTLVRELREATVSREALDAKLSSLAGNLVVELQSAQSSHEEQLKKLGEGLNQAIGGVEHRLVSTLLGPSGLGKLEAQTETLRTAVAAAATERSADRKEIDAKLTGLAQELRAVGERSAEAAAKSSAEATARSNAIETLLKQQATAGATNLQLLREAHEARFVEIVRRIDAVSNEATKRSSEQQKQFDRVVSAVGSAGRASVEASESLFSTLQSFERELTQSRKEVAAITPAVEARLAPLREIEGRLLGALEGRLAALGKGTHEVRDALTLSIAKAEAKVLDLTSLFKSVMAEANQKKGWWR